MLTIGVGNIAGALSRRPPQLGANTPEYIAGNMNGAVRLRQLTTGDILNCIYIVLGVREAGP